MPDGEAKDPNYYWKVDETLQAMRHEGMNPHVDEHGECRTDAFSSSAEEAQRVYKEQYEGSSSTDD